MRALISNWWHCFFFLHRTVAPHHRDLVFFSFRDREFGPVLSWKFNAFRA
jgi:aromatic ring-cleaving dioxygenase